MRRFYSFRRMLCQASAWLLLPALAPAAPFTPGNIVVARVGDGTAPLSAAATAVFLDEYTPGGTLVQTIDLPTATGSTNRILTASGNAASELGLTRSADGRYLVLAGYGAAPGSEANVAITSATNVARVVGRIAADGSFDTSTSVGDVFSGVSIRAAATADGSSFYSVGGNSGVCYQAFGSFESTPLNTAPTNIRGINIVGGNLYISTASNPYIGLSQVGTGLPTTDSQTATVLPGFPASAAGSSPYGFYLADLDATVPGVDVAYVADDRSTAGGIQKWSLVAGSWVLNGTITSTPTAPVRGLNGSTTGTAVSLVASSAGSLFFLTDNAGYNTAPSLTALPTAVATAGTNTAFRGIAFAPVAPAPAIASFTPASGPVGTTVTVTGTDFTGASAVTLNGAVVTGFTVVAATTITFVVPAGATSGAIAVTTQGGTATSTGAFTVIAPNPVPTIASLAPATAVAGSGALTLTLNGTGFYSGSVVTFNGTPLTTTFGSATQITAAVPASAIATAGAYPVTVTNAAPGGGTSTASTFTATVPAPAIASFTPASGPVGTTVTVTGTNFTNASAVTLNGAAITGFTVVDAATITFVVPAGATSGPIAVTTQGGTATSTGTFTVIAPNPVPTLASLAPATAVAGSGSFTLTVNGMGFYSGSVVSFNGTALTTAFVSATQVTAAVPAAAIAAAGAYAVVVTNAAPGGGASAAATFTATVPAPTIVSFTPATGGPGTAVTITGTNFTGATAVSIGSFAISNYTVVSATSITLVLPTGTGSVSGFLTVVTPGGTATSAATFNLVSAVLASQALPGLTVFPNPATDRITVALPQAGAATVALRDLTGRVVLAPAALAADRQLRLPAGLAAGVYLLEVRQGDVTALRRIEKK